MCYNVVPFATMDSDRRDKRREQRTTSENAVLEDIHASLKNLNTHAIKIGDELTEHNEILDDMDNTMDATNDKFIVVRGKTSKVIQRARQCFWPYGVIAILLFIVFILLIIVVMG